MGKGSPVIAYCRVSTAEQAEAGNGLAAQETAIRAECDRRGWILVDVVHDEGASAKTLNRPVLHETLARIVAGEAGGLVVAKLDRVSRSVVDFGRLLEWFDSADATLVALDLGMDTGTSSGRLVANVMASVAEWEREVISERTRDALAARKAQGLAVSRPAVGGELAARIANMRKDGATYQAIADALNAEKVPTLRGGTMWRVSSVQTAAGLRRRPARAPHGDLPAVPKRRGARAGR